jgi:hypothetical protein
MGKFELVNPIIAGDVTTTFSGKNASEAAQNFWEMLTSEKGLLVNELHHFMFTLRGENGNLHHFSVHEKQDKNNKVQYSLEDVTDKVESKADKNVMGEFVKEVARVKSKLGQETMSGGKDEEKEEKKDNKKRDRSKSKKLGDSSSSSDSDSDSDDEFDFVKLRRKMYGTPISYWWYSPMIYRVRRIFTPVFARPVAPYVQLWMPMR